MSKQRAVARTFRKKHFDWVEFKSIASFTKALVRDALDLACSGNMSFYHHGNERSWSLPPSLFHLASRRELWCVSPVIDCDSSVQWMKTNRTAVHSLNSVLIALTNNPFKRIHRYLVYRFLSETDQICNNILSASFSTWRALFFPISFQTKSLSFKKHICVTLLSHCTWNSHSLQMLHASV